MLIIIHSLAPRADGAAIGNPKASVIFSNISFGKLSQHPILFVTKKLNADSLERVFWEKEREKTENDLLMRCYLYISNKDIVNKESNLHYLGLVQYNRIHCRNCYRSSISW